MAHNKLTTCQLYGVYHTVNWPLVNCRLACTSMIFAASLQNVLCYTISTVAIFSQSHFKCSWLILRSVSKSAYNWWQLSVIIVLYTSTLHWYLFAMHTATEWVFRLDLCSSFVAAHWLPTASMSKTTHQWAAVSHGKQSHASFSVFRQEAVALDDNFFKVLFPKKCLLILTRTWPVYTKIVLVLLHHVGTLRNRQLTVYWQYHVWLRLYFEYVI